VPSRDDGCVDGTENCAFEWGIDMDIRDTQRRAAGRLWTLLGNSDLTVLWASSVGAMELCTWVVGRLAEDPDFQALVQATAREMAKGEARQRELRSRSYDDWPFGGLS
jgi:hypothetical protein